MLKNSVIVLLLAASAFVLFLTACNDASIQKELGSKAKNLNSMFVEVEKTPLWRVVYHKDTKVMYAVSDGSSNHGTFTLMVDQDGKPLLYNPLRN